MNLDDLSPKHRAEALSQLRKIEKVPYAAPTPSLPPAIIERDAKDEPLEADQGKGQSPCRVKVRIIRRSTKLLDCDNAYGSIKWICDAMRFQGLIRDDDPESIDLTVTQERCKKRAEAGTDIIIQALP